MKEPGIIPYKIRKRLYFYFYNNPRAGIYVDSAIDEFRKRYNIIIYHKAEPFVQPTGNKHKIMYCFAVKNCYPGEPNGWNRREYIGDSGWHSNIYEAKRRAIKIALKYVETRTDCKCTR